MQSVGRPRAAHRPGAAAGRGRNDRIQIVVAMQARLDRDAIAALLATQPDFDIVGCASSGNEVVPLCLSRRPRVLVLGALVPWPSDVSGVEAVRMCCPETEVLALAPHSSDRCAQLNPDGPELDCDEMPSPSRACLLSALGHGAHGAIHRDAAAAELFAAVRAVARGERSIGREIESFAPCAIALSSRERAVSHMTGKGRSNKEIAAALGISEGTVKKHIGHALRKLSLHDRLQLGLFVARHAALFEER